MSFSVPKITNVAFDDQRMLVSLADGRLVGVPLAWFPRLLRAAPEQRSRYSISPQGLHWDELDEDISIDGLLAGRGDLTHRRAQAA